MRKLKVRRSRKRQDSKRVSPACLLMIYGEPLGRRYVIDKEILIGRDDRCDIVLPSGNISRIHAVLRPAKGRLSVEDLKSTNGTMVNATEVQGVTILGNGDKVKIAHNIFEFIQAPSEEELEVRYRESVYQMAITDGLTGLRNRRFLLDFIDREVARWVSHRFGYLSVILFEVANIDELIGENGSMSGDHVLRRFALRAKKEMHKDELLARFSGSAFAAVLPSSKSRTSATEFAERVKRVVAQVDFSFHGAKLLPVIEYGIFSIDEMRYDGDTLDVGRDLLKGAEKRLRMSRGRSGDESEFYRAFISYSHNDKAFARHLYLSLKAKGILCWLDEHELLPGDLVEDSVTKAMYSSHKVILCCSRSSLNSGWVRKEISEALRLEQRIKHSGLDQSVSLIIPLDLDGYIFSPACDVNDVLRIKSRLIADFTDWEVSDDSFEEELAKLVRVLRVDSEGYYDPEIMKVIRQDLDAV